MTETKKELSKRFTYLELGNSADRGGKSVRVVSLLEGSLPHRAGKGCF